MTPRLTLDLALQGGGCKGIALNAALAEVMRRGHVIRRLVGTSAGAIAASLVAVGYTGEELVEMSRRPREDGKLEFAEYLTEPLVPASPDVEPELTELHAAALKLPGDLGQRLVSAAALLHFLDTGGLSSGEGFVGWYLRKLEAKRPGFARVTLGELHRETGVDLTLIATDTTARRLRALNHRTAPGVPLVSAVRMSMSIPLLFAEVRWREAWGPYLGESLAGHVMVDGGLSSNLPVAFILPNASALVTHLMGEAPAEPWLPVGLGLDTGGGGPRRAPRRRRRVARRAPAALAAGPPGAGAGGHDAAGQRPHGGRRGAGAAVPAAGEGLRRRGVRHERRARRGVAGRGPRHHRALPRRARGPRRTNVTEVDGERASPSTRVVYGATVGICASPLSSPSRS